jgi:formylglycine-generating enzyme required for sulfatase activity
MAWVLCDAGRLPRDRPELYEKILDLLLEQWDAVRRQQSIADVIGASGWNSKRMLPLLDRLSYEAHRDSTSEDGRGRIAAVQLQHAVQHHLIDGGLRDDLAAAAAVRCLQHFDYRSGLLRPDADDYVFAHLTLQEHCAGRHIALHSEDPIELIMQHRGDDRWREPIFLGMGLADPLYLNELLHELVDRDEHEQPKPVERWYRDLILAAEIGQDRDWTYLQTQPRVKVKKLQSALKTGLVELLNDAAQPLPVAERVRAGFLLGDLGDPRFPVTIEQWKEAAEQALNGDTSGYFCKVEPGSYIVGSSDDDPDADDDEKPQHTVTFDEPFWIARLPITNQQWQEWVQKAEGKQSRADDSDLNHQNQPVVSVEWYMCRDFCRWLSEQTGLTIRMPSEAEWEAAARGGDTRRYPWGDDWRDDHAATKEDQETRGTRWSTPVGCYPRGAAPGGALDMAGNVWEWTHTPWSENHDPPRSTEWADDAKHFTLKRGSYRDNKTYVRCAARARDSAENVYFVAIGLIGFRVLLSPRVPSDSR